ncbi:MAG TPA: hypothetical protein VN750_12480 [Steroidobacteraceae bacterium]|nr:hypothetical protein [Steroidobacteraceae bacterium]
MIGRPRKALPAYRAWPLRESLPELVEGASPQDFIRTRAAAGDTLVLIAHALKMTDETLRRLMREDPNLAWAYKVGCAQDEAEWVKLLKRDALDAEKTNTNALAYLNRRHGWRRETPESMSITVNNFNIPDARPLSDFIDVEVENAHGA